MKKVLLLLLCCLLFGIKIHAQIPCEFDSIYSLKNNEAGYRLLECKNGGFLIFQIDGQGSSVSIENPVIALTKIDKCGKRIWRKSIDSSNYNGQGYAHLINFFEDQVGNIEGAAFYSDDPVKKGIWLFKADSDGIPLRKTKIKLDSSLNYNTNNFIKLSSNRYIFTGSAAYSNSPNKPVAFAAMADTMGNVIFYKRFFSDTTLRSKILNSYQMDTNRILLLGYEDTVLKIINLDTSLNILFTHNILMQKPINLEYSSPTLSYDSNSFYTYKSGAFNFGKYTLNGELKKETNISIAAQCTRFTNNPIDYIPLTSVQNNNLVIPFGNILVVMDSSLNIIKNDTFTYCIYHAIQTKDSCIAATGSLVYSTPTNLSSYLVLNKTSLVSYVKYIIINGGSLITQNQGQLQLTASVLPLTAKSKNISWSINDSTKATISQTGLVTAISNGTIMVTARATDGSNIEANKNITITNQGVGITENTLPIIELFPNPATTYVYIQSTSKVSNLSLMDMSGKTIYAITNLANMDIRSYTNGFYLLKIETENGTVFKKIVIYN